MPPLPILYLVRYRSAVHVTHHPQRRITISPTTAYRACCVRDRASSSHKRDSSSSNPIETTPGTPHQHHTSTTPAAQQHSSRDSSRGGGDLTSPAAVYVPDFKNRGKTAKQDLPFKMNHFPKIRSHNGRPLFPMQLFWSLKTTKIIARNNR